MLIGYLRLSNTYARSWRYMKTLRLSSYSIINHSLCLKILKRDLRLMTMNQYMRVKMCKVAILRLLTPANRKLKMTLKEYHSSGSSENDQFCFPRNKNLSIHSKKYKLQKLTRLRETLISIRAFRAKITTIISVYYLIKKSGDKTKLKVSEI
jgi:hypothetical protein